MPTRILVVDNDPVPGAAESERLHEFLLPLILAAAERKAERLQV